MKRSAEAIVIEDESPPETRIPPATVVRVTPIQAQTLTSASGSRWRLSSRSLFLTYPQCNRSMEEMLNDIVEIFNEDLEVAIVASECHQDGNLHRHCLMRFKRKMDLRGQKWIDLLDKIGGKHGNYQGARRPAEVFKYVTKEGVWISYPENLSLDELKKDFGLSSKKSKSEEVAKMIKEGKTLKEVDQVHPGYLMMNLGRIQSYQEWLKSTSMVQTTSPFPGQVPPGIHLDHNHRLILDFLMEKVVSLMMETTSNKKVTNPVKQNGLFVTGPTAIGKSHFLTELQRYFRLYFIPMDEDFYDFYEDGKYDLIIMDEFKHQKKLQWMNKLLDGTPMVLRKKGGQILKTDPLPVMICSNYSLSECFPKVYETNMALYETIKRRLQEVSFHGEDEPRIDFWFYSKYDKERDVSEDLALTSSDSE